jgi:hypothetical protein
LEVTLRLNEQEARFLEALSGFRSEVVWNTLHTVIAKTYTEKYRAGFDTLMAACREQLPVIIRRTDEARKTFLE